MAEVIGTIPCPICEKEVTVKRNSNKKPTLYCRGCRVQVVSSGGQSETAIMSQVRPVEPVSTPFLDSVAENKEEKTNEPQKVVSRGTDDRQDAGGSGAAAERGGFLRRIWSGGE